MSGSPQYPTSGYLQQSLFDQILGTGYFDQGQMQALQGGQYAQAQLNTSPEMFYNYALQNYRPSPVKHIPKIVQCSGPFCTKTRDDIFAECDISLWDGNTWFCCPTCKDWLEYFPRWSEFHVEQSDT
jgi:hypothetical protein